MTKTAEEIRTAKIAALNDAARKKMQAGFHRVLMTQGVAGLSNLERVQIVQEIIGYENWTRGNDPYAEHDFGALTRVTRNGVTRWTQEPQPEPKADEARLTQVLFKIDYYAKGSDMYGSETPEDAETTDRVMTIMLAEEY